MHACHAAVEMFSAKKLAPLSTIAVVIVLLGLAQNGHGQYCSAKTKLQVAFVQDKTYSFKPFIPEFSKAVLKIMESFHRDTPDAEFALAAFADYAVHIKRPFPHRDSHPVNNVTSCYELIQNLTNDRQLFHDKVIEFSKAERVSGAYDPPESSMTAILYTIADIWMGAPPAGPDVKKIVILITDEETNGSKDAPFLTFKPKPKGKGDCLNYGYPSLRTVGQIMQRENIYIIGILAPSIRAAEEHAKGYPDIDIKAVWTDIFTELEVPFYVEMMPDASMAADYIVKVVRNTISRMACETPPANPPPAPTPPPVAPPPPAYDGDKIQLVFVIDRTQEFSSFLQEFAIKTQNVVGIFKRMFPHVEYGITAFADFPLHIKKGGEPQPVTLGLNIEDSLRCYENILPLTDDGDLFLKALKQFATTKWVNGFDPPESSMTALLYAAADKTMNWDPSEKTTKIIIIITDEDTVGKKDAPELVSKPKPKGDGLDTCTEHSFPDIETVRTVYQQNNLKLIGLFPRNLNRMKGWPKINTKLLWEKYFTEIGVKYHIRRLRSVLEMGEVGIKIIQGVKVMRNMSIPDDKDSAEDEGDAVGEIDDGSKKDKDQKGILKPTKLQIAFIIERKSTFHAFIKSFVKKSTEMMEGIRKLTANSTFNETEFGFAAFDDFDLPIKQGEKSTSPLKRISCYELICPMTNDDVLFRDKVLEFIDVKWENVAPDPPQSSLTALMYTAADFRMKWDKTNEHVKKIIVLITNDESVNKIDAPGLLGKPKPKGDGHDTCTDHSFADPHLVASQLTNGGFGVIALVGPSNRAEATDQFPQIDVWMIWDKYFTAMGIEYMVFPIPIQNNDTNANPDKNKPVVDPIEEVEVVEVVETTTVIEEEYTHVEWFEEVTISSMDAMVVNTGTKTSTELVSASGQKRDCEGLTKLQIVFVQDRSPFFDTFVKEFAMMAKSIATGLQGMFPEVEFGLTTFSDFHPVLKDGSAASVPIDKKLSCYERIQSLSSNPDTLVKTLAKFENLPMIDDGGDETQSSLTAVLYTAADKQMNWASKNEIGIKKVIFLITNMDSVNEDEAPKLVHKPKPEGTSEDTCFEHSYPDTDFVGEFLKNKGINVIALLPTNHPSDADVVKLWVTHLKTMGVKYDIQPLETNHVPAGITKRIADSVKVVSCEETEAGRTEEEEFDEFFSS